MQLPRILRAYPWVSLVATLSLVLVLIGFFWYQSSPVPPYPSAQNLSYERAEPSALFHVCGRAGDEIQSGIRITEFETSDSPDVVLQFYAAALVENSSYTLVERAPYWRYTYKGEQVTFEDETPTDRLKTEYSDPIADGYRVIINVAPDADGTAVRIREYQYERLTRACDPW